MGLRALKVRVAVVTAVAAFAVAAALATAAVTTVNKTQNSALGPIIVTTTGFTLYGDSTRCTGSCTAVWKPLLISTKAKPVAGPGVSVKLLGTVSAGAGKLQVTYKNHPLFTYSGDHKPGEVNGQGRGGTWHVLTPAGVVVMKSASSGSSTSSSTSSSSSSTSSSSNSGSGSGGSNAGGGGGGGGTSTTPSDCAANPGGYGCM
jgi:predicted lipoprotein with Yx(FWY)xxD motif